VLAPDVDSVNELARQISARALLSINDRVLPRNTSCCWAPPSIAMAMRYRRCCRAPTWHWVAPNRKRQRGRGGRLNVEWKPAASLVNAWQVLIETALNLKRVQFATYPVLNGQGGLIHYEAPARMQIIQSSLWMSAQEFMPWSSRLGLTQRIDEPCSSMRSAGWNE